MFDCFKSPRWALEDEPSVEIDAQQFFSYADARKYFLEALTLEDPDVRKEKWGGTFETLGHVVHHLQDMAQPQHVRNDAHGNPMGSTSLYEKYTEDNLGEPLPPDGLGLTFDQSVAAGFPTITFAAKPADFWATSDPVGACDGGACFGREIAQFVNYNFVSSGTNFIGELDVDAEGKPLPIQAHLAPKSPFPKPDAMKVDSPGRVILDWPYYDVSLLYPPPGTPESLTGSVGPVGLL